MIMINLDNLVEVLRPGLVTAIHKDGRRRLDSDLLRPSLRALTWVTHVLLSRYKPEVVLGANGFPCFGGPRDGSFEESACVSA